MIFVHGTCEKKWNSIQKDGYIRSRRNQRGSWYTNLDGNQYLIYLTNTSILRSYKNHSFHGYKAAIANGCSKVVTLHIPLNKLDEDLLRADENYLDVKERNTFDNCPPELRLIQRFNVFFSKEWRESLMATDMCAYAGIIEVDSIAKVEVTNITDSIWHRPEFIEYDRDAANNLFDYHLSACNLMFNSHYDKDISKYIEIWQSIKVRGPLDVQ